MIDRLCVVGVGLIGGSLARDLRALGQVGEIVGCSRHPDNLQRARELGVIDRYCTRVEEAVEGADMVLLACPLGALGEVLGRVGGALAEGAVVTDAGSAKRSVIEAARASYGEVPAWLVPGHPIAGDEHSGVEASREGLYRDHRVILTPVAATSAAATARVRAMWELVGANVIEMEPAHHDQVLAATSHLPHMLAYTLVDVLGRMSDRVEIFRYAAGGFRDFTRIASSDPQMWHDICVANQDALVEVLERFQAELGDTAELVRRGDSEGIQRLFTRAKALRDRYTRGEFAA